MSEQPVMHIEEILEYLPHRYPALLVDRVTQLEPGAHIAGYKNVSVNEPFFPGHFPGHPIMPGVMIVEAMAQLAGILGFKTAGKRPADGYVYYLAGVDKLRLRRPVVPGDRLDMEANFIYERRAIGKFECVAHVSGELACEATLLCAERRVSL